MEQEQWKVVPIKGYEKYMVSNFGRVKTLRFNGGKILTQQRFHKKGYPITRMNKDKEIIKAFFTHRLVAMAFVDNPNNYPQINHKDCNKANNHYTNLEWCTNKMNHEHAKRNGLMRHLRGEDSPTAKLTQNQVLRIRELFAIGWKRRELAEKYNTKPSNIKDIVLRRSWKHI